MLAERLYAKLDADHLVVETSSDLKRVAEWAAEREFGQTTVELVAMPTLADLEPMVAAGMEALRDEAGRPDDGGSPLVLAANVTTVIRAALRVAPGQEQGR
jgi:hypothetical protein